MTGTPVPFSAVTTLSIAVIWGTPTPATTMRRADGTRADPDLDAVGAGFDQGQRCGAGGDVAADDVHMRVAGLDPAHTRSSTPALWP